MLHIPFEFELECRRIANDRVSVANQGASDALFTDLMNLPKTIERNPDFALTPPV